MTRWLSAELNFLSQGFTLKFRILKSRIKFSTIDTCTVAAAADCVAVAAVGVGVGVAVAVMSNWQKSEGRLGVVHDDRGRGHDAACQIVGLFACGSVSPEEKSFHNKSKVQN